MAENIFGSLGLFHPKRWRVFHLLTNVFFGVPLCKQVGIIETKLLRSTIVSLSHTLCGIMGFPKPPENVHQTDP